MKTLVTLELIDAITQGRGDFWFEPVRDACDAWEINTEHRVAMFLAQTAHESNRYRTLTENLKYSGAALMRTWRSRFGQDDAERMAYDEFAIAERAYGGRMGNGPEGSGDGFRYRGRGILQITGKASYAEMGKLLGDDLIGNPEQLVVPLWAAYASAAWWDTHGCSQAADDDDFEGVTRIIQLGDRHNTGRVNGMSERLGLLSEVAAEMA
jgi:putative chitinase